MGNDITKTESDFSQHYAIKNPISKLRQPYLSQMSLSSFVNNLSWRSFTSGASHQSTYSVSRPWSRISRRRWQEKTLNDPLIASKTAWPVPFIEAFFLPDFKISGHVTEKDFNVLCTIAKGAFGKVYKVQKIDTGEIYALKILSKSQIISQNAINQVKDEVKIQSMCGHNPFIVNCPFYWQNRKQLFIVSDYVPGGELQKFCEDYGPLPEELVQIYVAEIAFALDFLHNAGVIYRDLKLENILLDGDAHLQLIDFGLAKWLNYGCRTSTICGTIQYMAPEVFSSEPYGHAVDWWSLGVVTCRLLTGQYPAVGEREAGVEGDGTRVPGSLPEQCALSPAARTLLTRLLERDPRHRLRSILKVQEVAFFKDFNFADARSKKTAPHSILNRWFPNGPPTRETNDLICAQAREIFREFDCSLQGS